MLEVLTAAIIILYLIYTYSLLVRVEFATSAFLASWNSVSLLGYCCTTQSAMRHYRLLMTVGLLSGLAIAATVMISESLGPLVYNNVSPQMLFTCAVFLFFRKHGDSLFVRIPTLFSAIDRYSFSILLIHWPVLHRIVGDVFSINGLSFEIAGGISVSSLLTLVINLAPAFLYDNMVVLCMDRVCKILFDTLGCMRKQP